jgi:hypothetical protein
VLRVFRNIFNADTGLSRFGRTAVPGAGGRRDSVSGASATSLSSATSGRRDSGHHLLE